MYVYSRYRRQPSCALVTEVQRVLFRSAGVWDSSVDLGATDGVVFDDLNTKLDAYVGYKREVVPGLTADVGLLYYYYPKDSNIATDYFEPYVSLSVSLGPVNAKVGLNYAWGGQNADRKSTRMNSSHKCASRMPSSA